MRKDFFGWLSGMLWDHQVVIFQPLSGKYTVPIALQVFFTQCVFSSALKSLHWIHRHCPRPEVCRGNLMRRTADVQLQKHFMIHSVPCCILYAILLIFNTLDLARRQCQCVNYFYVYVEHSCSATWLHIVWSEVTKPCLKFGKCVDVFWVFCIMSLRFCHLFLYFCKYQHAVE